MNQRQRSGLIVEPASKHDQFPHQHLVLQINEHCGAVKAHLESAISHAVAAGKLLRKAKSGLHHGGWVKFLQTRCDVSVRTAQAYMRLASAFEELAPAEAQRVAHLPLRQAMRALSAAEPEKPQKWHAPAEQHDVLYSISEGLYTITAGLQSGARRLSALYAPGKQGVKRLREDLTNMLRLLDEYEKGFASEASRKSLRCISYEFPVEGDETVMRTGNTVFLVERHHQIGRFMVSRFVASPGFAAVIDTTETARTRDLAEQSLASLGAPERARWFRKPATDELLLFMTPLARQRRFESLSAWLDLESSDYPEENVDRGTGARPPRARRVLLDG